jgi:hypothetical protein
MTLKELKKENHTAHDSLVEMWSELSRCSMSTAKRYLNIDMDGRFSLKKNERGEIIFHDSVSEDVWKYSETLKGWTWLLNFG